MTNIAQTTLLTYRISPTNVEVSSKDTTLTIAVSNSRKHTITISSIQFTFSLGPNAKDLIDNTAEGITITPPDGWQVERSGATFTMTSKTNGDIGGDGLIFTFSNVVINNEVGTASIGVIELEKNQSIPRTTSLPIGKFPQGFYINYFSVKPEAIKKGGSVTVSWSGSSNASYSLEYFGKKVKDLKPVDQYEAKNIEQNTHFFLNAEMCGSDPNSPVTIQKEVTAVVLNSASTFSADKTQVFSGDTITLSWSLVNATSASISDSQANQIFEIPSNQLEKGSFEVTTPKAGDQIQYFLKFTQKFQTASIILSTIVIEVLHKYTFDFAMRVGSYPTAFAISPTGQNLYVANGDSKTVAIVDTTLGSDIKNFPFHFPLPSSAFGYGSNCHGKISLGYNPNTLLLSSDGKSLYVSGPGNVSVIDIEKKTNTSIVSDSPGSPELALSPDNRELYITNSEAQHISIVDTSSRKKIGEIDVEVSETSYLATSSDGRYLYCSGNGVTEIDTEHQYKKKLIVSNNTFSNLAVSPTQYLLYALHSSGTALSIIDTTQHTPIGEIPIKYSKTSTFMFPFGSIQSKPTNLAISPDGKFLYTSVTGDIALDNGYNSVAVLDTASKTQITSIPTGISPSAFIVSPDSQSLYITTFITMLMTPSNAMGPGDPNDQVFPNSIQVIQLD